MAIPEAAFDKIKKVKNFISETPSTYSSFDKEAGRFTITVCLNEDDMEVMDQLARLFAPA